eukprot:CAMPEP_0115511296 /NCGR_PEP_ID=MMETSP0271-20121206/73890_1 /TAXON_ID=71861 /ORGANISM="Scrippsiella trochoidea, Strain CCMP3099" /LENGTH=186 /DNA_ID=CAMNT_0002941357 /DNA_START=56 /DNA_END=613 /DNA_ORIENTATION=-
MTFHDEVDAGELTSRLSSDCQTVFTCMDDALNFLLRSVITVSFGFAALARISFRVTAAVSLVLAVLVVCTEWYGQVNRRAARQTQDKLAELNRIADEGFGLLHTVRGLDAENIHARMYQAQNSQIYDIQRERGVALGIFNATNGFLTTFVRVVALVLGGVLTMGPQARLSGELLAEYILYLDMVVE